MTPIIEPNEILDGCFMRPEELSARMMQDPADFVPTFRLLWARYLEKIDESSNSASLLRSC